MLELTEKVLAIVGAVASIVALVIASVQFGRVRRWQRELTWDDALRVAESLLTKIKTSGWQPDVVLGVGRSGGIWGGWLAGNLGSLPFAVVDDLMPRETGESVRVEYRKDLVASLSALYGTGVNAVKPRVLIVEGASSRGEIPGEFRRLYAEELQRWDARFAVLYKHPASGAVIDFVGEHGPELWPKRFPWHRTDAYRPHLRDIGILKKAA